MANSEPYNKLNRDEYWHKEWLVTNGLGGFASYSICGAPMRKYHGWLIAALPAPFGRTNLLNYIEDVLVLPDKREVPLSLIKHYQKDLPAAELPDVEFFLDSGLPVWHYYYDGIILEKRVHLINRQNTVHVSYHLISSGEPVEIKWRPYFHFRSNEQPVNSVIPNETYQVSAKDRHYEVQCEPFPVVRLLSFSDAPFTLDRHAFDDVFYEVELKRGYESVGTLTSPGFFTAKLQPYEKTTFACSTEAWETLKVLSPNEALFTEKLRRRNLLKSAGAITGSSSIESLVLAANQFIFTPYNRQEDLIRLQASGEEIKSIIAGFPWFTDWGRDTMISLEGLTLTTGQVNTAYTILRTFAYYVKDGLIPNMFPDGEKKGIYNTADATLWFFHATDRYIQYTNDTEILDFLLPKFNEIIRAHVHGTHYGIKMDEDGLLKQGQEGYQLTWMDAKVGDWVVTPRRGKAVEINALWYNALKLMETWTGKPFDFTQTCYESFNKRFWNEKKHYLNDVVDGEQEAVDEAMRPNQLFAISLRFPVLVEKYWRPVVDIAARDLLSPVGLRTLGPLHPDYKPYYEGDLKARDAAYHQGTIWPWLIGAFIDAWLKVYPEKTDEAYGFVKHLEDSLNTNCMGTIAEIFDATAPFQGRGCYAQAWSVAEVLRILAKVKPGINNAPPEKKYCLLA